MASKVITQIKDKAEELAYLRKEITTQKEEFSTRMKGFEERRDELQNELLQALKKQGLSNIKTDEGESYSIAKRKSIEITSELQAFKWAYDNRAVSINKILVKQKLKGATEIPSGFEFVENEYISVRGVKEKETNDND